MVKKKAKSGIAAQSKAAIKEAKKVRAAAKVARKEVKSLKKSKEDDGLDDDRDLEGILEKLRIEWEDNHRVTEETADGPPSRRANATLTPDPSGNYLWCIGGEYFSEDGKAHFYNDVYRYSPDKVGHEPVPLVAWVNEWKRFVSPTCPGPRSAHAVVATASGGGKLFLFGGEFSSLHQTTFHHYRDTWVFDITSKSWERIATKIKPSARSGHRMVVWKHFIVLFGGFFDPGIRTQYLNDLWVFDALEYTWKPVEITGVDRRPSPRSGFSFLPTPDGIVLYGGYYQDYVKGKRPQGVVLDDTWFLRMSTELKEFKWERRKKISGTYAPPPRSGCTMALWANSPIRSMGILFGGVRDVDESEEALTSEFFNDIYGYHTAHPGKWVSLVFRKKRQRAGQGSTRRKEVQSEYADTLEQENGDDPENMDLDELESISLGVPSLHSHDQRTDRFSMTEPQMDNEAGTSIMPIPRYNSMLAVLRNTLYIYGGILERGTREHTLDDFWSVALDKMDEFVCLRPLDPNMFDGAEESSSDEGEGSDDEEDEDKESDEGAEDEPNDIPPRGEEEECEVEEQTVNVNTQLHTQAADFLEETKTISPEEALRTPLPGETLAGFYARAREYWAHQAHITSDNRGKELRRDGFALAQERYDEYRPLLQEVEKILSEAGLDAEEMKRASEGTAGVSGPSRNRR